MKFSLPNVLLLLANVGFVAAGALLVSFAFRLQATGWTDVLDGTDYEATAILAITVTKALGFTAIALALLGAIGALTRNRVVLTVYLVAMVLVMLVFGVIAGTAFAFKAKARAYDDVAFPATADETAFAETFNDAYCYAQGAYYCNNATAAEAFSVFLPDAAATAAALLPDMRGINSLCDDNASLVTSIKGMAAVCKACAQAKLYAKYDKILTWANDQCPRTAATSAWCGQFLATNKPGAVYTNSPYAQCRDTFLGLAADWANGLALTGVFAALAAALLVGLSCASRRSKHAGMKDAVNKHVSKA